MKRALLPLLAATLVSGCVSFGGKAPSTLLTLSPDNRMAPDAGRTTGTGMIAVLAPSTPSLLATDAVAVLTSSTGVAYLKDARWADQPARLFADLLGETIAARTGRVVIDRRQNALTPAARLSGRLTAFALDAQKGEVVVGYDAAFMPGDGQALQMRRFEARVATASEKPPAVAQALNRAANQVAAEVADWIGK